MGTLCPFLNPFLYLLNGNENLSHIPLRAVYGLNDIMHMHVLRKLFKALYNYKIYIIIKFLSFKYFKKAFQGWWLSSWVFFFCFSLVQCLEMTTKRKIIGRLVPCRCFRGEEEIISVLDYSHCSLQQVPKEVFNFERTLEELYLDANQIEELPKVILTT